MNTKVEPALDAFPQDLPLPEATHQPAQARPWGQGALPVRSGGGDRTKSGNDWAWTREQLRAGCRPPDIEAELASRRPDKSNPAYYARRTVERAVESLAQRPGPTR